MRWSGASRLDDAAFASRFLGRGADDRVVRALRGAAQDITGARDHGDLRQAAEQVAVAMQVVGLGNWGRFLADAQARADDPATLAAVAASQPRPAPPTPPAVSLPAAAPVVTRVAAPSTPIDPAPPPDATPAVAAEPEHGAIWQWLHGLGLAETRHEQAVGLRRVMGAQSGLIYRRNGVALDVDHMSDDDVLALDKETRGQSIVPLVAGAAATLKTPWGWKGQERYNKVVEQLKQAGTHETLDGTVPTREEAVRMIEESGGRVLRVEEGHPPGRSTHNDPHINYYTAKDGPKNGPEATEPREDGPRATVIVKPWISK